MANTSKSAPRRVAFLGLFIALAMILSYVESLIPPLVAVQGVKIGLPNLVIMFMLYRVGSREAITVSLIRVVLVSLLFSSAMSMAYGLAGAALSLSGIAQKDRPVLPHHRQCGGRCTAQHWPDCGCDSHHRNETAGSVPSCSADQRCDCGRCYRYLCGTSEQTL